MKDEFFDELCLLSTGVVGVFERSDQVQDTGGEWFCANVWYGDLKPQIESVVGWYANTTVDVLQSSSAYLEVLDRVYENLPACRGCGCPTIEIRYREEDDEYIEFEN